MRSDRRSRRLVCAGLAVIGLWVPSVQAQQPVPRPAPGAAPGKAAVAAPRGPRRELCLVGVVTVRSLEALGSAWRYVSTFVPQNPSTGVAQAFVESLTANSENGLDTRRPFGLFWYAEDMDNGEALIFLPVKDEAGFQKLHEQIRPMIESKLGPYRWVLNRRWFFAGPALEDIGERNLPDPDRLVPASAKSYDLAYTAQPTRWTAALKKKALERNRQLVNGVGLSDDPHRALGQKLAAQWMIDSWDELTSGVDDFTLGLRLQPELKRLTLDVSTSTRPGSKAAKALADFFGEPSSLRGVVDPAAFASLAANFRLTESQARSLLELLPARSVARPGASDDEGFAAELTRNVVASGRVEVVICFRGDPKAGDASVVAALRLKDPAALERGLLEAGAAESEAQLKRNVASHNGVAIHEAMPPKDGPEGFQAFGADPRFHFAFGKDYVLFSIGSRGLNEVKRALERAEAPSTGAAKRQAFTFDVKLRRLLELTLATGEAHPVAEEIASLLSDSDRLHLEVEGLSSGARCRIELGDGFLRALAQLRGATPNVRPPAPAVQANRRGR